MKKIATKISGDVEFVIFPDNGPEQGDVARWVDENGGQLNLYDGNTERDVATSTGANWRWKFGSISGINSKAVMIGDYVVKDLDGSFKIFSPESFKANFVIIENQEPDKKFEFYGTANYDYLEFEKGQIIFSATDYDNGSCEVVMDSKSTHNLYMAMRKFYEKAQQSTSTTQEDCEHDFKELWYVNDDNRPFEQFHQSKCWKCGYEDNSI